MSRPKKRTESGRLTKEAAEIVVEMLREGAVQGNLKWLSGVQTPPTFERDRNTATDMPYFIGGYWVYRDLSWSSDALVGFTRKADRKEFERRWNERYPKEMKPETELTYPLFAKSITNDAIILFTSADTGICVATGESGDSYGEFSDSWINVTNTNRWQHLTFAEAETEIFGRLRREPKPKAETV